MKWLSMLALLIVLTGCGPSSSEQAWQNTYSNMVAQGEIREQMKTQAEVIGRQVGRYQIVNEKLLDTVTGNLYFNSGNAWVPELVIVTNFPSLDVRPAK